jgi:hypothetical protein
MVVRLDAVLLTLVEMLGWSDLRRFGHSIKADTRNQITWYRSWDIEDMLFQINIGPRFCAAVFAVCYSICSGWHQYKPHQDRAALLSEPERLCPLLGRANFQARENRSAFLRSSPRMYRLLDDQAAKLGSPNCPGVI